jgi:hypothetical protein
MSTLKTNNVQVGQSVTATQNFTLYQPATPDGTVRLGVGNSGATSADAVIVDNAGLFKFNSGFGSAATAYGCRAWVNFNGTGTIAIRASANVTSLTDNGTGNYTVNLTTAMPDANYSVVANHDADNYSDAVDARATGTLLQTLAAGSFILRTYVVGGAGTNQQTARDYTTNTAAIFR